MTIVNPFLEELIMSRFSRLKKICVNKCTDYAELDQYNNYAELDQYNKNGKKYSVDDISQGDWQQLDYLLESVEKGQRKEEVLLYNKTFLYMLLAIKEDGTSYSKMPPFISQCPLVENYCKKINPNLQQLPFEEDVEYFRRLLGFTQ